MKNAYIVMLGDLYFKEKENPFFGVHQYRMTDSLNHTSIYKRFDYAKKTAEEIGGKVYKVNLTEVE